MIVNHVLSFTVIEVLLSKVEKGICTAPASHLQLRAHVLLPHAVDNSVNSMLEPKGSVMPLMGLEFATFSTPTHRSRVFGL
jgi:hypothetical protein